MKHFLSTWTRKNIALCVLTVSFYTVTLMLVFLMMERAGYDMFPHFGRADAPRRHSNIHLVSTYCRRSSSKPQRSEIPLILGEQVQYNEESPGIPPEKPENELADTLSVSLHEELPNNASNTESHALQDISSTELKKNSQQSKSQTLNVEHVPRQKVATPEKTKVSWNSISYFRERLSSTEIKLYRDIIEIFDILMTKNGLEYMLYGGSLVGSYRHHGMVPWDDDIDVLVPLSTKDAFYTALESLRPQYILSTDRIFTWKLFSVNSNMIRGLNWGWPYLDIFFYNENDTHIWDAAPQYSTSFVYPKSIVFPLKRRPFMGLHLLAPYNSRAFIHIHYNIDICSTGTWIHKWERHGVSKSVPCFELYFKFPFVFRMLQNGGCSESLVQNDTVVSFYFEDNNSCDR